MIKLNLIGAILSVLFSLNLKQFSTDAASSSTGVSVTVTWDNNGASTDFVMSQTVTNKGNYFAFAFSEDQSMGNDDVAVCMLNLNGTVSLAHYYNKGKAPIMFSDPLVGYSNIVNSYLNNVVKCSFTRTKTMSNLAYYYDLTKQYYILFAYGSISAGSIDFHNEKVSSPIKYDFQSTTPTITGGSTLQTTTQIATTTTTTAAISNQTFTISWKNSLNSVDFVMSNVIASAGSRKKRQASNIGSYFAFGLSKDTSMGDDDVAVCILYPNGTVDVLHYYNAGKSPSLMSSTDPKAGLTNIKTSYTNSILTCSFTRAKTLSGVSYYFDLNSQYYLLTASGLSSSGSITRHTSKASSPSQFNFLVDGSYSAGAGEDNQAKFKAHGCLMVFAWLFCASTGILFARYYKYIFPKKKLMGVQFWFFVHRPLMISVPIISLIAFLIILSSLNWKWIDSTEQQNFAHSITGILTIAFSFVQVFLAFFRCDKDHPKRFVFNYFHRTLGITTFVLAIVTIFIGVCIDDMNLGRSGWGIMIGWTIWVFVLPLIIEIFQVIFINKEKGDSYKIKDKVNGQDKFEDKDETEKNATPNKNSNRMLETTKSVLLVFHLVVAFAFTLALIIMIGIAKKDSS